MVEKRLSVPHVTTHCSAEGLEAKCCASAAGQTACFVFEVNKNQLAIDLSVEFNGSKHGTFTVGPKRGRLCLPTPFTKLCFKVGDVNLEPSHLRVCGVVQVEVFGRTVYTSPQLPCVEYKDKQFSIG